MDSVESLPRTSVSPKEQKRKRIKAKEMASIPANITNSIEEKEREGVVSPLEGRKSVDIRVEASKPKKKITWKKDVEVAEVERHFRRNQVSLDDMTAVNSKDADEIFNPTKMFAALETEGEAAEEYYEKLYETGETDEEYVRRVYQEWEEQDKLNQSAPPSWASYLLLLPMMIGLKLTQSIVRFLLSLRNTVFEPPSKNDKSFGSGVYWRMQKFQRFDDMPLETKKQAAMVFFFLMVMSLIGVCLVASAFLLLFPLTTLPMGAYLTYIYFDQSPENGSRVAFMRYWRVWRHFVNYFPIRLVKTCNLDPKEKYVMSYHPHGIISFGAFGNFATDATGFSRLFPGISLRVLTLSQNFIVPWVREILLWMGICSCSKKSCHQILQRGPGSAILLVVGGADESLLAAPGTYRLNVNGRKGFVRVALDNQAHLVPVLGFGENDAFTTKTFEKGSYLRSLQDSFKKKFGFATPVFWGTDATDNEKYGFMPHKKPIVAVVGKPVKCPKVPAHLRGSNLRTTVEGRALVNKYHEEYIKALRALYNAFKNKWAVSRSESLMLVGRKTSLLSATAVNQQN